ncbi:hypothetical protein GCM10007387_59000 [Pseudoduganella albidiflava]|uniref:Uncharacterized protein n=1 Tax=Pseudoduganella albidiflava TaxID=321983 RepID=A0AA87XYE4_9BURK|nr:hypothetical protein GCM10007387_59000 [Pseudoduganella albidiflava]
MQLSDGAETNGYSCFHPNGRVLGSDPPGLTPDFALGCKETVPGFLECSGNAGKNRGQSPNEANGEN